MTPDDADVTVADLTVTPVDDREYDFAVVARATLDGPAGPLRVRRRYEALPRHNDVLDAAGADGNDELVDRPDAVHVHTKFYAGDGESYLGDAHDGWLPPDRSVLGDADAFAAACRDQFRSSAAATYEDAPAR